MSYTTNRELFGNATHAYAEAFNYKLDTLNRDDAVYDEDREENEDGELIFSNRRIIKPSTYDRAVNTCAVEGARLLRNPKINQRVNELLNDLFRDDIADGELAWVMMQRVELAPKVAAIKEHNAVKARIRNRIELTGKDGNPLFDEDTKKKSKNAVKEFLDRGNTRSGK